MHRELIRDDRHKPAKRKGSNKENYEPRDKDFSSMFECLEGSVFLKDKTRDRY